ncbi:hypothetical protein VTI74DRAFT_11703 [Chaetomium olivicolor]
MPIINGQKMACAPCIRGHRSTKCNHYYERVMVPVRKPGRPLSTCPCPPGRPCACGGVRVAIPKKQKCGCSTATGPAKEAESTEKEPSPPETPTSPSRPSFRVTKSSCCSKTNNRKQSFDPANLERMDPRSINVIASPKGNGVTNGVGMPGSAVLQGSQTDLNGFGPSLEMLPSGPGSTFTSPQIPSYGSPMPYNMGFQYTQANQYHNGVKLEDGGLYSATNGGFPGSMPPSPYINGNQAALALGSLQQPPQLNPSPMTKTNGATSGGSCCSSKAHAPPTTQNNGPTPMQHAYGQLYIPKPAGGGSCCGSKAQTPSPTENNTPQMFGQTYIPQFQYPTVFTYPGDYGSWQHPIDPIIWHQVASQTVMPLNTPVPSTARNVADMTADAAGTSHQCSCGEGCQCVGCLAHPFNAQMFQYVNNAYSGSSNVSSPANGEGQQQQQQQQKQTHSVGAANGHETPQEAPTPAASEGSPPREEQSLSTLDYFFVNLPISGLCGGNMETCPCGDSCDCPGCLVHNVPLRQG